MTSDLEKIEKWIKEHQGEAYLWMPQNKDDLVVRSHTLLNYIQSLKEEKQPDKGEMAFEILEELKSVGKFQYPSNNHTLTSYNSLTGFDIQEAINKVQSKHKEKGDE